MSNAGSAQRLGLVSFANPALHDPAAITEVPIDPPGWIYRENSDDSLHDLTWPRVALRH